MSFGNRLRELRIKNKLSMEQFGNLITASSSRISDWENGKNYPSSIFVVSISNHFGVTTDWLLKGTEGQTPKNEQGELPIFFSDEWKFNFQNEELLSLLSKIQELPIEKIGLLDILATDMYNSYKYQNAGNKKSEQENEVIREEAAGKIYNFIKKGEQVQENIWLSYIGAASAGAGNTYYEFIRGYIPVPVSKAQGTCFIIEIDGDSMSGDNIHSGDLVVIRQQRTVEAGKIVLVRINDEFFLKRIKHVGSNVVLISSNKEYPDREVAARDVQIVGIYVHLIPEENGIPLLRDKPPY